MNILHIAFKFEEKSAATQHVFEHVGRGDNVFILAGMPLPGNLKTSTSQVYPRIARLVAYISYAINLFKNAALGVRKPTVFSSIQRNWVMENLINSALNNYNIDKVYIHWGGYGFVPPRSIARIRSQSVSVVHHDWRMFTGGCHVPARCVGFPQSCTLCPYVRRKTSKSKVEKWKTSQKNALKNVQNENLFVSEFQKDFITNSMNIDRSSVRKNTVRTRFLDRKSAQDIYDRRKLNDKSKWLIAIGVNNENDGNKGSEVLNYISANYDLFSNYNLICVACKELTFQPTLAIPELSTNEIFQYISAADLVLVPSRIETFSLVSFEATKCGTPVVVFPNTAPTDFDAREYVVVADKPTPQSFADAISSAISLKERLSHETGYTSSVDP